MNVVGFLLTLAVAGALVVLGRYVARGGVKRFTDYAGLFAVSFVGVYGGSELFGELVGANVTYVESLSQVGPQVGGFYIVTGIIGGLVLSMTTAYAMRRAIPGAVTDLAAAGIQDPPVARLLFNDSRVAALWLGVRLYVGYEWLASGVRKVTDPVWMNGGAALKGFWTGAIKQPAPPARPAITYDWYRDFLAYLLNTQSYTWFAKLVAVGEVLIGVGLIVGCLVGFAAFFGALMNFNFMLAGTASTNPVLFALAIALILAWKVAGYYGIDRYLLPLLGAPWSPGKLFPHGTAPSTTAV